jgi:hypothetical protein
VAPPSVHPTGKRYTWEWRDGLIRIRNLAEICIDVTKPETPKNRRKTGKHTRTDSRRSPRGCSCDSIPKNVRNPKAYCQIAFSDEIRNILNAPKPTNSSAGKRNTTLFNAVWKLKRYFGILDEQEVLERLSDAASKRGLPDKEIRTTIESALKY